MVNAFRWMVFVIGLAVVIGSIMIASAEDPVISIDKPSDGETVNTKTITVSGTAEAMEGYIDSVTVNDIPAGIDTWSADIQLEDGPNPITVVATDDMGQSRSETITVYYQALTTSPSQPPRYDGAPSAIPTPTPTPKLTMSISITTIPSGAKVWLDDSFKGTTPTPVNVTVGYHEIKVIKEGYHSHSETKKILLGDGEPEEMIIELKPLTASIYISSTPSGASVYIDNVDMKAITPSMLKVVVGPHTITLTKSGYFDAIRTVSVSADGLLSLHETLISCGYITISSDPPGAKVYIDGNYTGVTPKNICKVVVGNHTIKLTKFGYDDVNNVVFISAGRTPPLHEKLAGYGYINISSDPSGARVYLDGNYTGVTPETISKVYEGNYSIRLAKQNHNDVTQEIQVSAGNTTSVSVPLSLTFWGGKELWIPFYTALTTFIGGISVAIISIYGIIPFIKRSRLKEKYLFNWDSVPGNDDEKFKKFFKDDFDIGWAGNAEIIKSDDGKTISISKDENSAEIMIDEKKKKAILRISDDKTHDLKVKKENGKLNIYKK